MLAKRYIFAGHSRGRKPAVCRAGLGMVEALISLAIAAALLTAVGVAFTSSAKAMKINDDFFRASQAARVAVNRIMTQARCGSVDETSTSTSLHIITDSNQDLTYTYDSTNKQLKLITNSDLTDPDYVLARNVTSCTFIIELGTDYNNATCVSRVTLNIKVTCGTNDVLLSGSAAPRRNIVYK